MTLHEAIEFVLREFARPMSPSELADYIFNNDLYARNDNAPVNSKQILARVRKYPQTFSVTLNGFIELPDLSIKPYIILSQLLNSTIYRAKLNKIGILLPFLVFTIYENHKYIVSTTLQSRKDFLDILETTSNSLRKSFEVSSINHFLSFDWLTESLAKEIIVQIKSSLNPKAPKPNSIEFGTFFNELVNEFVWDNHREYLDSSTPSNLIKLINGLAIKWKPNNVFDPFAGRACLLVDFFRKNATKELQIIAGDINVNSKFIGDLNLFLNGATNTSYRVTDAFSGWNTSLNVDLILSSPPFGKIQSTERSFPVKDKLESTDLIDNAMQLCIYHLNPNGNAIIVVPTSFLTNEKNGTKNLRKYLIDDGFLKGVIQLPRGIFKPYAAISASLIILSKEKRNKNDKDIFLFDGSYNTEEFGFDFFDKIIDSFHHKRDKGPHHCWVSSQEMIKENYEYRYLYYSIPVIQGIDVNGEFADLSQFVELSQVTEKTIDGIYIPKKNRSNKGLPLIEISNLSYTQEIKTLQKFDLNSFINDKNFIKSHEKKILAEPAVLISTIGKSLKATVFNGSFEAFCSSEVFAIICKKDKIIPEYLILQFFEKYFIDQINRIKKGSIIPRISVTDFFKLKVRCIDLSKQQEKIAQYYKRKATDSFAGADVEKDDVLYNLLSRIIHSMRTPLSSLNLDLNDLVTFITLTAGRHEGISLEDFIIDPLEEQNEEDKNRSKLVYVLPRITRCINDIKETLMKAEGILKVGRLDLTKETFYIKLFLENDIKPIYQHSNCCIDIQGIDSLIEADKYQMKELFKNFIDNALKHGFSNDSIKANNKIIIKIQRYSEDVGFILIEINNNGNDFPEGFNLDLFEKRGISTDFSKGFGFGGYLIKKIIENHGGYLRIDRSSGPNFKEFNVRFIILLPIQI